MTTTIALPPAVQRVAIYARVSSEQQAQQETISSQVAALQERVRQDGFLLDAELSFLDEGYSGATLARPALERLRDQAHAGAYQRLYVHSPDRLARRYAYQVLLVDELRRCGTELVFLNRAIGVSAEEDLLLQMQGMIAEYERAKIMERSRRGKRHAAQRGSVNVLSGAPYGYRYVTRQEGAGTASYEILEEQALIAKQVFEWVGRDRLSIGEVCRRLKGQGTSSPKGKSWWDRASVWGMLRNPAYAGLAAFGKTRIGERRARPRPQRGGSTTPRRSYSVYDVPVEEQTAIPVPAIVNSELFEAVAEQLACNRRLGRERKRGARYLLQGLLECGCCGYAYYGKKVSRSSAKGKKPYAYYRCVGTDAYRFGGQRLCQNKQVRTDRLDEAVWSDVQQLLHHPDMLRQEFERRLASPAQEPARLTALTQQLHHAERTVSRLIDAYADGVLDKKEFEPRLKTARQRLQKRRTELDQLVTEDSQRAELRHSLAGLEEFMDCIRVGLEKADWHTRREIIRLLVQRVQIETDQVRITYRISLPLFVVKASIQRILRFCWRGNLAAAGQPVYAAVRAGLEDSRA